MIINLEDRFNIYGMDDSVTERNKYWMHTSHTHTHTHYNRTLDPHIKVQYRWKIPLVQMLVSNQVLHYIDIFTGRKFLRCFSSLAFFYILIHFFYIFSVVHFIGASGGAVVWEKTTADSWVFLFNAEHNNLIKLFINKCVKLMVVLWCDVMWCCLFKNSNNKKRRKNTTIDK